jgi:hypothetical protein
MREDKEKKDSIFFIFDKFVFFYLPNWVSKIRTNEFAHYRISQILRNFYCGQVIQNMGFHNIIFL